MIERDTYEARLGETFDEMKARIAELELRLLIAMIKAPELRPVLRRFVRALAKGKSPRTRVGRFVEEVRLHYAMLRLERAFRIPRARTVTR